MVTVDTAGAATLRPREQPATSASAQQEVYKWVDKDGVTHFSATPPTESELANTDGSVGSRILAPTEPETSTSQPIARC